MNEPQVIKCYISKAAYNKWIISYDCNHKIIEVQPGSFIFLIAFKFRGIIAQLGTLDLKPKCLSSNVIFKWGMGVPPVK